MCSLSLCISQWCLNSSYSSISNKGVKADAGSDVEHREAVVSDQEIAVDFNLDQIQNFIFLLNKRPIKWFLNPFAMEGNHADFMVWCYLAIKTSVILPETTHVSCAWGRRPPC